MGYCPSSALIQMGARVYLASIARFTSLDPVAGGTANNYVYALDPINFSDYSGNCILQCTGGSSLQGSLRIVQGSSPAIQGSKAAVQTTISSQRLQGTYARTVTFRMQKTIAVAKPAYDNSTARPKATVTSMFISKVEWKDGTLRVYPTMVGRLAFGPSAPAAGVWAWMEVLQRAPEANTSSMRDQFFCHWDVVRYPMIAPRKESWNLDASRPYVGYGQTILDQCNP